ncbi:DUF4198 domain-containing protein [Leminorella grimontii]|uniref:DUF4198 domain-containing protein n=1 Tax=Leminorella grimontii TaxID=82981 RepID=UPI00321FE01A
MKLRLLTALCATALLSAPALAHELWINVANTPVGQPMVVEMGYGDNFPEPEAIAADRLAIFSPARLVSAAGEVKLEQKGENYRYVSTKPAVEGSYLAIATYNPTYWAKNKNGWKQQSRREMTDASYCQLASMYGKTVVNVGNKSDAAFISQPQGIPLEIVPLADPAMLKGGQTLPVELRYQGKPLANHKVSASYAGYEDPHHHHKHGDHRHLEAAFSAKTDDKGRLSVPVDRDGYWVIFADKVTPIADKNVCDEEKVKTTFTFNVGQDVGQKAGK